MISSNTFHENASGGRLLFRGVITVLAALCFTVSATAVDPARDVSQYLHESWGAEKGFPGDSITAIAQTSDGYLWIGTDKGLVRFNGFNFHEFEVAHPDPIQIGPVRTLVVDSSDNLWILLQNTQVFRYHNGVFEPIRGWTEGGTTAMARGTSGDVLLSSSAAGTLTFSGNGFRSLSSATLLTDAARTPDERATPFSFFDRLASPTSLVTSMAQTDDGKVWLATEHRGLFYLQQGRISGVPKGPADRKIHCFLPNKNSELWVGTENGILRWNGKVLSSEGLPSSLLNLDVLSILRDRDSNIWIGTSRGLFRYNANGVSLLNTHEGIGPVTALFEDREGNIWFGSARGLERLRDSAFVTYSIPNLKSQSTGPVYVDSRGRAWVAPIEGGLRWLKGETNGAVTADGIASDVVYSIAGTDRDVWVGRQKGGLTHLTYSGNSFIAKTYTKADGLAQDSVYAVYESQDGTVWSGTLSGGVSKLKEERFTNYTTIDGLASNTVSSIAEEADGSMWFGTPNGLSHFSKNQWRTYDVHDGLVSPDINCLLEDSGGVLWIGTAGGLAFLRDGRIQTPQSNQSWLTEPIFGIAEDGSGSLWIATSARVLRAKRDSLTNNQALDDSAFRIYGRDNGLEGTEGVKRFRSLLGDSKGNVWFSTTHGLSVVNPDRRTVDSFPPVLRIEMITVDGNEVNSEQTIPVPSGEHRIVFHYLGLTLTNPERVRYRYWLEGLDRGWSEVTGNREATFSNLKPGKYRFRLVCSNREGVWDTQEASLQFSIAPAWFQTIWFRTFCVVAFFALLWSLYWMRLQQVRRQFNISLEARLNERARIINTIPALAWAARPDGAAEFFNQRWHDYTGLTSKEAEDWGWKVAIHPDDLDRMISYWKAAIETGEPVEIEGRLRRFDGEFRWFLFRANAVRDESEAIVKWYGTNTDIDDRKRAEEQVHRSEAFLVEGQRLSRTGTYSWRPHTGEITWSKELYRIFEVEPGTPISLDATLTRIHPDDISSVREVQARGLQSASDYEHSFRVLLPDGRIKFVHVKARATRGADGQPEFIGAAQDVTDSKIAEEALNRARSELAHVSRVTTLNALTASITHEINQPLASLVTNASICLRRLNAEPPNVDGARETVQRTIRDANRATDVITRLRALFSKKEIKLEPLDLNEVTREVIALSLNDLQRNEVILRSELGADIPPVIGDRVQLQQVTLNLLRNGSDAMTTVEGRPRQLLVRTQRDGLDRVCLSVQDSGCGVNPQDFERLFEAFYTTKKTGMGIGLSVSRSIIERHHGRLWAERNDGPGITFSFSIPCSPEGAQASIA